MKRTRRDAAEYLGSAGELAQFLPQFKKFGKRKTLKPWEKAWIARTENVYRGIHDLRPVSKREAREFPELLYEPTTTVKKGPRQGQTIRHAPIQAVQQSNAGDDFKILGRVGARIFVIRSNGRVWVHWHLPSVKPRAMGKAGEDAFTDPYTYEIEGVIKLAEQAYARPDTKAVYLLAERGRVGAPMPDLKQFIRWLADDYGRYENTDRWVKGIAILIGDEKEKISLRQFASFAPKREKKPRDYSKRKRKKKRGSRR